jgi:hypothetical protein
VQGLALQKERDALDILRTDAAVMGMPQRER